MRTVGFIGLGTMGMPMAENLSAKGYHLRVFNRTKQKANLLHSRMSNVQIVSSPREVAEASDVVFTMLTADDAVNEVCFGDNGIVKGSRSGLTVIDCSTVSPAISRTAYDKFLKNEVNFLDAPVTGSEPQAIAAKLTFMVGGTKEAFNASQEFFQAMGQNAYYMGESGAGSYTKLANNTMAAINMLSLSESLVMASKAGVNPETFMKVVAGGGARSGMAENKSPKIFSRDFSPNFAAKLMLKDLGLASQVAREMEIPTPVLAAVRELMQLAVAKGLGEEDMSAVVKCYEEWAGITILPQS